MANENTVSIELHKEFEERMNDNLRIQNEQIKEIKGRLDDTHEMVGSVASLASSMQAMAKEQSRQGSDIREIRTKVESINVEHIELKINEHDRRLDDHDCRLREQEQMPQDSTDHENRLRAVESAMRENKAELDKLSKATDDQELRLREQEGADGRKYRSIWGWIVAAVISGIALPAIIQFFSKIAGG